MMPEYTPQQIDEYRTQQAIAAALGRQMVFSRPLSFRRPKPRKPRSDKNTVANVLTEQPAQPTVGA